MKYCHPLVRSIIFGQSYSQTGQTNGQNIKIGCNNVETAPTDVTTLPQLRTWPNIRSEEIIAQTSTLLPLNKITLTVPTLRNHAITTHPFIPFARSAPFISSFYVYSRNGTFAYLNPETKLNRFPTPWISQWHWLHALELPDPGDGGFGGKCGIMDLVRQKGDCQDLPAEIEFLAIYWLSGVKLTAFKYDVSQFLMSVLSWLRLF